jgi:hypothetical protein
MKLSPPTQLVVLMFLSFGIVLGTMILFFRPQPDPRTALSGSHPVPSAGSSKGSGAADSAEAGGNAAPGPSAGPVAAKGDSGPVAAQEQADLNLLKAEVESRLKTQMVLEDQKVAQLAGLCARMEPGRAAAALSPLDEATVRRILSRLDRDLALRIQSVLVRIQKGK